LLSCSCIRFSCRCSCQCLPIDHLYPYGGVLCSIALPEASPTPPATPELKHTPELAFEPYTDDPDLHSQGQGVILLQQREIIEGSFPFPPFFRFVSFRDPHGRTDQDTRLDHLSSSIHRQHHISLQINDELEVHTGLLGVLDTELDGTQARMAGARRRLARVARGARENGACVGLARVVGLTFSPLLGSTVTIGLLILVLLVLIVVFKT